MDLERVVAEMWPSSMPASWRASEACAGARRNQWPLSTAAPRSQPNFCPGQFQSRWHTIDRMAAMRKLQV